MIDNSIRTICGEFTRTVAFRPAFDKTHPDPKKNYGIGSVILVIGLTGPLGTISCEFYTDWYLKKNQRSVDQHNATRDLTHINRLGSIDSHSPTSQYEGQFMAHECMWTGGVCYCDGSSLQGGEMLEFFIEHGLDALWVKMEEHYKDWLGPKDVASQEDPQ